MTASPSAKRNFNLSIESDNADFIKRNGINLSKEVDALIREMRRKKDREAWALENREALAERSRLLEAEGGSAAERLYGLSAVQEG